MSNLVILIAKDDELKGKLEKEGLEVHVHPTDPDPTIATINSMDVGCVVIDLPSSDETLDRLFTILSYVAAVVGTPIVMLSDMETSYHNIMVLDRADTEIGKKISDIALDPPTTVLDFSGGILLGPAIEIIVEDELVWVMLVGKQSVADKFKEAMPNETLTETYDGMCDIAEHIDDYDRVILFVNGLDEVGCKHYILTQLAVVCFENETPLIIVDPDSQVNNEFVINPNTYEGKTHLNTWICKDAPKAFNEVVGYYYDPFEGCKKCEKRMFCDSWTDTEGRRKMTDQVRAYLCNPTRNPAIFQHGNLVLNFDDESN